MSRIPVFFGSYSAAIRSADFDPETGAFSHLRTEAPVPNASFLWRSPDGRRLYAVEEGNAGTIHAFAVTPEGGLWALNTRPAEGDYPCDVSVSPDGALLVAANYMSGSVVAYTLRPDGSLNGRAGLFTHTHATRANPRRQEAAHAHGVTWSEDGRHLLVPDLGGDRLYVYRRDASAPVSHPGQPWIDFPAGSGPRHAAFAPGGRHLYVLAELGCRVFQCAFDPGSGTVTPGASWPTLPTGFAGANITAEIAVHPSGRTVYASNRGHDSLAVFDRDPASGALTLSAHLASPKTPRHFVVTPDGRWLVVAGQDADRVESHRLDPESGRILDAGPSIDVPRPVCVRF